MTSIREAVIAGAFVRLSADANVTALVPVANIYRSRVASFQATELPAIIVRKHTNEAAADSAQNELVFSIEVHTRGTNAEADSDAIEVAVHRAITRPVQLVDGVGIDAEATHFNVDDVDGTQHQTVMLFRARYRAAQSDLASANPESDFN
jgi:hypothetical protein